MKEKVTENESPTSGRDETNESATFAGCFGPPRSTSTRRPSNSSQRAQIAETIRKHHEQIIEGQKGAKKLSASAVLAELAKLGQSPSGIRRANAIGDVLGKHYLGLPAVFKEGKMRYALHLINSSDEEKAAAQAELDGLPPEKLRTLIVA
jgi:hypothetical protein